MKTFYIRINHPNGNYSINTVFAKNRRELKKAVKNTDYSEIRNEYGFKVHI
jgi:hypothetical protein